MPAGREGANKDNVVTCAPEAERPLMHEQQGAFTGGDYRRSLVIPFVA